MTIDTILSTGNILRFRKNLFQCYKNDRQNKVQFDLDRKPVEISAFFLIISINMSTGESALVNRQHLSILHWVQFSIKDKKKETTKRVNWGSYNHTIIQKDVDYRKLKITGGNNVTYDFSD